MSLQMESTRGAERTAAGVFNQEYNGQSNVLTPELVTFGRLTSLIFYEISRGSGIHTGETLYGLTLVAVSADGNKTARLAKLSDCFATLAQVKNRVVELGRMQATTANAYREAFSK